MLVKGRLSDNGVWVARPKLSYIGRVALRHYRGGWIWVGRPKHYGVVLLMRGCHHYGWPKWWGAQRGGGSRDVPNVGIVHLLDRSVGNLVGPHHVLEAEGCLWHRVLRDAL